jgi:hypothetical protein
VVRVREQANGWGYVIVMYGVEVRVVVRVLSKVEICVRGWLGIGVESLG